jgi:DNA-binding HxlR family transcriptional regulator
MIRIRRKQEFGIWAFESVLSAELKMLLLYHIASGVHRPGSLHKNVPRTSVSTINKRLKEMEEHGFLTKTITYQIPPKVEYRLTDLGWTAFPIVSVAINWVNSNRSKLEAILTVRSHNQKNRAINRRLRLTID